MVGWPYNAASGPHQHRLSCLGRPQSSPHRGPASIAGATRRWPDSGFKTWQRGRGTCRAGSYAGSRRPIGCWAEARTSPTSAACRLERESRLADAELETSRSRSRVCEQPYYRWRNQFGGLKADDGWPDVPGASAARCPRGLSRGGPALSPDPAHRHKARPETNVESRPSDRPRPQQPAALPNKINCKAPSTSADPGYPRRSSTAWRGARCGAKWCLAMRYDVDGVSSGMLDVARGGLSCPNMAPYPGGDTGSNPVGGAGHWPRGAVG